MFETTRISLILSHLNIFDFCILNSDQLLHKITKNKSYLTYLIDFDRKNCSGGMESFSLVASYSEHTVL